MNVLKLATSALLTTALFGAASSSYACSLVAIDPAKVKTKLAAAIADELGWDVDKVSVDAITTPELRQPLGLGADCSGLDAFHHSAGFRIVDDGCTYEGVAVLLGYWYTNPVAVHHNRRCAT